MLKAWRLASFPCLPRDHNWEIIQNPDRKNTTKNTLLGTVLCIAYAEHIPQLEPVSYVTWLDSHANQLAEYTYMFTRYSSSIFSLKFFAASGESFGRQTTLQLSSLLILNCKHWKIKLELQSIHSHVILSRCMHPRTNGNGEHHFQSN
jgi:hypothetical protein